MSSQDLKSDRHVLLFDLFFTGHHAGYILHLIRYWREKDLPGNLDILVVPSFIKAHPDVVEAAGEPEESGVQFVTTTPEEEAKLKSEESLVDRAVRTFQEWGILNKYVKKLQPTHCFFMYFDSILLATSILGKLPCPASGIYFRPIFHYGQFSGFTPSRKERFLQQRDKYALVRLLKNKQLRLMFSLDPFAAEEISKYDSHVKAMYLPDPVQIYEDEGIDLEQLRRELGIEAGRKAFLMFGVPQPRKGIYQLLEAITLLPKELCRRFCLLLVGPKSDDPAISQKIQELSASLPVQIVSNEKFVQDREIQPYFRISDVVLAPYQNHVGMSAILVRAAAAGKPVLSCSYGLMGEMVKQRNLGLTVDATSPAKIAEGLREFILEPPEKLSDASSMEIFAKNNSAENFASTVFQNI